MMDLSKFKDLFISEVEDHLDALDDKSLDLEKIIKIKVKDKAEFSIKDKKVLDELMRSAHTIKSSSATMGYTKMAFLTHVLEDIFDYARNDLLKLDLSIADEIFSAIDKLKASLESIKKNDKELNVDKISKILKKITGVETTGVGKSNRGKGNKPVAKKKAVKEKEDVLTEKIEVSNKSTSSVEHIKVPIQRLDALMDLMEELLIDKMRFESLVMAEVEEFGLKGGDDDTLVKIRSVVEHLGGLISNLQYHVMQARLVPVGQIFSRFPRMVRDLATQKKKEINLEIDGADLEVDRTIVDKLGEPLVHLLRNAIDHGISKKGIIRLYAKRERDLIKVIVEDDGAGINWSGVVDAASKRQLVTKEEASNIKLSMKEKDQSLWQLEVEKLLFHPRLSTNTKVTETSGRGVGLSVVKEFVQHINGDLVLESPIDSKVGTRFTLEMPITLAIINSLLVSVQNAVFAIPFSSIERAVVVKAENQKSMADQDVAVVEGKNVPLVSLENLFGLVNKTSLKIKKSDKKVEKTNTKKVKKDKIVVLVKKGKEMAGLVVDSLLNEQEITVKPLPPIISDLKGFSGSAILGDGETILIIDVGSLLEDSSKLLRKQK